jgi:hypothetical protein
MDSLEQFSNSVRWTAAEKKVARRAFDLALERRLSAITAQAKSMMANASGSVPHRKSQDCGSNFPVPIFGLAPSIFDPHAGRMVDGGGSGWLAT